jgi:hypothetical protein
MSNEELFQQVESLLDRKLTPEEYTFLTVAKESLKPDKNPPHQIAKPAKIA